MSFEPVDRLPVIEFAEWWDKTLAPWYRTGLPSELENSWDIREYFGLDVFRLWWISPYTETCPVAERFGGGLIRNIDQYRRLKPYLFPERPFSEDEVLFWAKRQASGQTVIWITLEGFFWFPRQILGIEPHLYAFYDQPELIHLINEDLLRFSLRALDTFCKFCVPDFMTIAEDFAYNSGPMISEGFFRDFLAPHYRKIVPEIAKRGIIPFLDSDGDITRLVPWARSVGFEGILPLERRAGVDVAQIRKSDPEIKMIGGFDKFIIGKGEEAIRQEFERLLPVMKQGGFIPSADHQIPPEISLEQYRVYLRLLNEYCREASRTQ